MTTNPYTDKIKAALAQLDPANPEHWTDDGLPVTKIVQTLADEPNLKRSDINAVAPMFSRENAVLPVQEVSAPVEPIAPVSGNPGPAVAEVSEADFKAALQGALAKAEAKLEAIRAENLQGRKDELVAQKERDAALMRLQSEFPPMTAAENIQQYLQHEQDERARKHGVHPFAAQSQIDAALSNRGKARGWGRPQRGQAIKTMPDGRVVRVLAEPLPPQPGT